MPPPPVNGASRPSLPAPAALRICPGMTAAKTSLPVLGVPIQSKALNGIDSILSIAQMPSGIPVATFAIGVAGASNAALFAAAHARQRRQRRPRRIGSVPPGANRRRDRQAGSAPLLKLMRVGIVGAGQLGRMLALAGYPIGVRCLFLDRSADAPGAQVAPSLIGDLEDAGAARGTGLASSDVLTFDWENISGKRACATREDHQGSPAPRGARGLAGSACGEGACSAA